jgi:membrane fusion protein (multidrug efflux system)
MRTNALFKHLGACFIVLGLFGCDGNKDAQSAKGPGAGAMAIDVWIAIPEPVDNQILANGTLLPNEEVELRNEISGRVEHLAFQEGQPVKAGQLLLQIDDAALRAQLQKLKTQLDLAQKDKSRKAALLEIKGISQEIFDAAATQVAALEADIALTTSQIRNARIQAPFSGRVGLRYISPGAYLSQGDRIALLIQDHPLKVEFSVPQRYAGKIAVGQTVTFTHAASNNVDTAVVYAIEPRIDINTRTLKVRARTNNQDRKLIPGAFVEVKLNLEHIPDALMIPTEIIIPQLRGEKVFVIRNGQVTGVDVTSGMRTETHAQIEKGIQAGDTIAATALLALKEGMKVTARKVVNKSTAP